MTVVNGSTVAVAQSITELVRGGAVTTGSVVRVPAGSGSREGVLVLSTRETASHRRCAIITDEREVLAAGPWASVAVYPQDVPVRHLPEWAVAVAREGWEAIDVAQTPGDAGAARNREIAEAESQRDAARAELSALQQRLEAIVSAAHEYADANSLCGEFDRFMEAQGLRGRPREFSCPVTVTVTARVRTRASSPEAAMETLTDEQVHEAMLAGRFRDLGWQPAGEAMPR